MFRARMRSALEHRWLVHSIGRSVLRTDTIPARDPIAGTKKTTDNFLSVVCIPRRIRGPASLSSDLAAKLGAAADVSLDLHPVTSSLTFYLQTPVCESKSWVRNARGTSVQRFTGKAFRSVVRLQPTKDARMSKHLERIYLAPDFGARIESLEPRWHIHSIGRSVP